MIDYTLSRSEKFYVVGLVTLISLFFIGFVAYVQTVEHNEGVEIVEKDTNIDWDKSVHYTNKTIGDQTVNIDNKGTNNDTLAVKLSAITEQSFTPGSQYKGIQEYELTHEYKHNIEINEIYVSEDDLMIYGEANNPEEESDWKNQSENTVYEVDVNPREDIDHIVYELQLPNDESVVLETTACSCTVIEM